MVGTLPSFARVRDYVFTYNSYMCRLRYEAISSEAHFCYAYVDVGAYM